MELLKLRCRPGAQFRLGSRSLDRTDSIIHSDTLFSGLANVWAMIYGDVETLRNWFDSATTKVRMSSGLYAVERRTKDKVLNTIYFLPRPPIDIDMAPDSGVKIWKKVRFISLGVYKQLGKLTSDQPGLYATSEKLLEHVNIGGKCLCTAAEMGGAGNVAVKNTPPAMFTSQPSAPKVHVHKSEDKDAFYTETNLQFRDVPLNDSEFLRGHFYVLIDHALPEADWNKLLACFRILADEGVGGERSTGKGRLESVEVENLPDELLNLNDRSHLHLSLSMFSPRDQEEFDRLEAYDLTLRGAWTIGKNETEDEDKRDKKSPKFHRKQVRLVHEGALLSSEVRGRIVDVSPDKNGSHPIYRNGTAFTIPI